MSFKSWTAISVIGIILFFNFWLIWNFPHDINAEVVAGVDALRCLQKSHLQHSNPQDCFSNLCQRWETQGMEVNIYNGTFLNKLWSFILSGCINISGYSVFTITLASAVTSLLALFLIFKLGCEIHSRLTGILSALFLTTSILYNMGVKSGYGFVVITAAALAVFYFLSRYFIKRQKKYLIMAGIILGIGSLDCFPQFFFCPVSAGLLLLFDKGIVSGGIKGRLGANIANICLLIALAITTSLAITAIYCWYYNVHLQTVYQEMYSWIFRRMSANQATHQYVVLGLHQMFKFASVFVKNVFFGMSPLELDDYAMQLEGIPMITPAVSIFFIPGVFFILRKKDMPGRLILIWVGLNFLAYMFLIRVQTRYVETFLPGIYIISAIGLVELLKKIGFFRQNALARQAVYAVVIFAATVAGYRNFFITYKNNDSNQRRFCNNSRIAGFIATNSSPQNCEVVLADNLFSHRDSVRFNMKYRPYNISYLEEILYNKAEGGTNRTISSEEAEEIMRNLESKALSENKKVYYVFSEHDIEYYPQAMVPGHLYNYVRMFKKIFLSVHPELVPVKVLYYSNGDITHSVYVVTK